MGGVAVLQPQDFVNNHYRNNHAHNRHNLFPTGMKSQSGRNPNSGPTAARSSNRRRRSPPKSTPAPPKEKKTATNPLREKNTNNKNTSKPRSDLGMGQVKILKRGDVLPTWKSSASKVDANLKEVKKEKKVQEVGVATAAGLDDLVVLSSTDRLGPEPDVVPKHIRISDFYAGSAFIASPPPSSLPVPVFFKKKDVLVDDDCGNNDYDATSGSRRLLRLDLS